MRSVHSPTNSALLTFQSTSARPVRPAPSSRESWASLLASAACVCARSSARCASSAARRAASSSASMAATPFEMSRVPAAAKRDVAVTEASAAWSDRDSADADALPGVLTSLMPNVCISWETPPAAVANPTPRQPASTHDAQARPTIFSASPPVRYALRFFKQNLSLAAYDQTAKAATACFRLSKGFAA